MISLKIVRIVLRRKIVGYNLGVFYGCIQFQQPWRKQAENDDCENIEKYKNLRWTTRLCGEKNFETAFKQMIDSRIHFWFQCKRFLNQSRNKNDGFLVFKRKIAKFWTINVRANCLNKTDRNLFLSNFKREENFDRQNGFQCYLWLL